ncbi:hypothetical protein AOLI_G00279030 [Acnodon oligacanthus]
MPLELFFFRVLCYHEALRSCIKTESKEVLEKSRTEHRGHAAPFTFIVDLRVRGSCAVGMLGVLRRLATVSSGNEKAAMVES